VVHHILTTGRPVFAKARHLEPAKRWVAEEEFAEKILAEKILDCHHWT
jgi:hypothetical protein